MTQKGLGKNHQLNCKKKINLSTDKKRSMQIYFNIIFSVKYLMDKKNLFTKGCVHLDKNTGPELPYFYIYKSFHDEDTHTKWC